MMESKVQSEVSRRGWLNVATASVLKMKQRGLQMVAWLED